MERVSVTKGTSDSYLSCAQVKGHPELAWEITSKKLLDLKTNKEVLILMEHRLLEVYLEGRYRTIGQLLS